MKRALACLVLAACGASSPPVAAPEARACRQSLRILAGGQNQTTLVEARCGEIYEAQVGRAVSEARAKLPKADWDDLWLGVTGTRWRTLDATCAPGDGHAPYLIEITEEDTTRSWVCFGKDAPPPPFDTMAARVHRVGMKALGSKFKEIAPPSRKIGIPACDEYLEKSRRCVGKMPESSREMMLKSLDQVEEAWENAAQNPDVRGPLGEGCRQALDAAKQAYQSFGCEM